MSDQGEVWVLLPPALLLGIYALLMVAHFASAAVAGWRTRRVDRIASDPPAVTLIRPVCGLEEMEKETLASTFFLRGPVEVIFCVERAGDPAVPFLKNLMDCYPDVRARLLIGTELGTANPKLNNIAKGWAAASNAWIIFADSNLMLPPDYVARVIGRFDEGAGVVCAPPIGSRPETFWAEMECAFLNTFQARWQFTADTVGYGFAQGKTMVWRRAELEAAGGMAVLGAELAEDAASTKLVRSWGKRVKIADGSFHQPLGRRTAHQVISRQLRWAQLRRMSFPLQYGAEALVGSLPPLVILWLGCVMMDCDPVGPVVLHLVFWYSVEAALAFYARWHWSLSSLGASMLRDALLPLVWTTAFFLRRYEWRGNAIDARKALVVEQ